MQFNKIHLELFWAFAINVFFSVISIVVIYFLTKWFIYFVKKTNEKVQKIDPTLLPITLTVIKYASFVVCVLVILNIFGANTNGIIAFLGAAGVGVALALKETLQNIASGIMLIFLRPFQVNDYIESNTNIGTVQEINLFTTTLKTPDGLFLFVPNSLLWNSSIKNFTRNGTRRLDINVSISYESDAEKAREIILNLTRLDGRILKEPSPIIVITALNESAVNVMLRCWVLIDNYWDVNYYLYKTIKTNFEEQGISIPYPQRNVNLKILHDPTELVKLSNQANK
ncbi:mechanosensitive ion channel family protein [Pigmentibacter sp. JX0631]|uniref:mechanosensitive ion channel family protein n=1 Tax=Pigmentibacter sp. JX0631 TaxID=2976982 RepID=UPI002469695E|nr:mechanosensitive ion channel family protein [Pigmentibacter sp. JX0631]WGL59681.1 mechanosensitive ion channel family protein [Pigmentibacter sp. JX0631]